ncbi:tail protein X [Pseudorhizobium flavum]|uniref:tail protein X n=1 Tax=Pseudorhizobium flavum TaxID=1335061 RepID=UPI0024939876|nr:tail protein X [Pseudorhizobium flavum]
MAEPFTVKGEGLTVELVLHRLYGLRGRELVEQTFRDNPGLAAHGTFLPLGAVFTPPDLPPRTVVAKPRKSLFKDKS